MNDKLISKGELKRELQAYEKVNNHLLTQIKYYRKKHQEEQEKFASTIKLLDEYETEEGIREVYGWGYITEDEMRMLMEAFETGNREVEELKTVWSISASIMGSYIKECKLNIQELQYELMTDEEKARHNEAVAKHRERSEERKAKRGGRDEGSSDM